MMEAGLTTIDQFATRVRQLMLQYASVRQQNDALRRETISQQERISQLEAQLKQMRSDY